MSEARQLFPIALLVVALGCSAARARIDEENARARERDSARATAELNIAAGCYDCLIDARAVYAMQLDAGDRQFVQQKLFELDILLALREKEVSLSWDSSLARARALVPQLPTELQAERILAMVEAIPADEFGSPAVVNEAARRRRDDFHREKLAAELEWLRQSQVSPVTRYYLTAALECGAEGDRPNRLPAQRVSDQPLPPIVQYRRAICGAFDAPALSRVRTAVPRFVETSYFLAQLDLATAERTGGTQVRTALEEVHSRFLKSSGATYLLGLLARMTSECERALTFFGQTIALSDAHEQAHLGRTICLTDLKRNAVAIASATRMVELRVPNVHEAYYWRAVNQRTMKDLPAARADIDLAKSAQRTNDILTMAGIIEFEQNDLATAVLDLTSALNMRDGLQNCTAAWYLGRVYVAQQRWSEAASRFERSMNCCTAAETVLMARIRSTHAQADIEPAYKALRLARFEQSLKDNSSQHFASAFNAANYHFRAGNLSRARELVEIAAQDSTLAEPVAQLRTALKGR